MHSRLELFYEIAESVTYSIQTRRGEHIRNLLGPRMLEPTSPRYMFGIDWKSNT